MLGFRFFFCVCGDLFRGFSEVLGVSQGLTILQGGFLRECRAVVSESGFLRFSMSLKGSFSAFEGVEGS